MPFHVFLSHSSTDKPTVEELARRLAKEDIQAWLDKWHLIPGNPSQPDIEKALAESETLRSSSVQAVLAVGKTRKCVRRSINVSAIAPGVSA